MLLKDIVPWGRLKDEYIRMFHLTDGDLKSKILGCGDGPSSFNCECNGNVVSIDPIYKFTKKDIQEKINEIFNIICDQLKTNLDDFIWTEFENVDELKEARLKAMNQFLGDYEKGKLEGRYMEGELPELNFTNKQFDIVLSSHFLFLYSSHLSFDFHLKSLQEMIRVGRNIRIFPLCDLDGNESKHLKGIVKWLDEEIIEYKIIKTNYEFQKGSNSYLEIKC